MVRRNLGWNPKRVLFGLSRIGYTPHTAIADIVDNSIGANAKNINIQIQKEREDLSDSRKNNIKSYLIIDDGDGMSLETMSIALDLGNDDIEYADGSLSKFGLGLKSASFSQGNILEVVSSTGSEFNKLIVNLNEIENEYFCSEEQLSESDLQLVNDYLSNNKGTIIRVSDIHSNNHPSPRNTIDALAYRLGTVYYYFLKDGVSVYLNGEDVKPYDVLFTEEADTNGNLNEHEWNGREVRWIKKPTSQTLDIGCDPNVTAIVECTQLPHPPTFDLYGEGERAKVRSKYKIEAGNYGYYVYRNKRLISWAERFDGLIPQDQDFYSFRGRILLDESADDAFNIDVKKSHLELSEEAWNSLSDLSDEYKRKSKKSWNRAISLKKQMLGEEPNSISNEIAAGLELPEILPGEEIPTPDEEKEQKRREEEIKGKIKQKIVEEANDHAKAEGKDKATDDDVENYASGGVDSDKRRKIFRVPAIEDNLLWEPYYDDDHGWSVRINNTHRFARCVFEDNSDNSDMQVIVELFMLQCAQAEIYLRRDSDLSGENVEEIVRRYRETISNLLVQMMRKSDMKLPPLG